MTTVDSWPKILPMMSVGSWNSTTETHLLYIGDISVWSLEKKERKKLETNLVEAWLENHQFSAVGANNLPIVHKNGIK